MKDFKISELCDIYGRLLTPRQSEVLAHYFDFDLSYGEIAEILGISRQGVGQIIEGSIRQLEHFDNVLKLSSVLSRLEILKQLLSSSPDLNSLSFLSNNSSNNTSSSNTSSSNTSSSNTSINNTSSYNNLSNSSLSNSNLCNNTSSNNNSCNHLDLNSSSSNNNNSFGVDSFGDNSLDSRDDILNLINGIISTIRST